MRGITNYERLNRQVIFKFPRMYKVGLIKLQKIAVIIGIRPCVMQIVSVETFNAIMPISYFFARQGNDFILFIHNFLTTFIRVCIVLYSIKYDKIFFYEFRIEISIIMSG